MLSHIFVTPNLMITGKNALQTAAEQFQKAGRRALIVTDPTMVEVGNVKLITDLLDRLTVGYAVFDGVTGEPTDNMVAAGKKAYLEGNCDFLIALGGGSPIDTMKAIGAMITNPGVITDYLGRTIPNAAPATIAIPTTAGTGSEATQFTIITDTKRDIKMLLKGEKLIPSVAIIDYRFSMTAPAKVTAATGIDALCHAIESYTSRKAQPISDLFAMDAVKKIFRFLPRAFENGKDEEAREAMSLAALEAGIAFNNASVTLVHGMSRPIGALFHVPHGLSNAMLLPNCLSFALPGTPKRFAELAVAIGASSVGMPDLEAGEAFIRKVRELCDKLRIDTPASFGIDRTRFFSSIGKMTEDALASGSPANTMREINAQDIKNIYESLWNEVK